MNVGYLVPVIVAGEQEKILRAFRNAGATSPDSAKMLGDVGCRHSGIVDSLVRQGILIEAEPLTYYVSLVALDARKEANKSNLAIAFMVLVGLMVAGFVIAALLQ